ncbi:MAG: hypothetical protein IH898_04705, partial [Planctomycetes bacterium]|nr:hypothetical protein [Planctomycetota bacterium]
MANRIFVLAVVVLWLSSMSWLVIERILPSFYAGEPPIEQAYETGKAVAWQVQWKGKPVGRSASVRLSGVGGTTDLVNRVLLTDIPLMELAPTWMRTVIGDLGNITFDAHTRIEIDALGNFSSFNSRISINELPSVLNISGRVEDSFLQLRVHSGDISYTTPIYLPDRNSLNEVLFPDAKLPQMYVGRSWQEKIYSPFHSPSNPVELVQAEVVSVEAIQYGEEMFDRLNIFRETPEASMEYLISSGHEASDDRLPLLNLEDPTQSLLVLKPTSKLPAKLEDGTHAPPSWVTPVSHMGGLKMHLNDASYKSFVTWIQDYAKVVGDRYDTAAELPADNLYPSKQVLRLKDAPQAWAKGTPVQFFVHAWNAQQHTWAAQASAFTQGLVTP